MQLTTYGYQMLNYVIITGLPSLLKSERIVCNYSVEICYSQIQQKLCQAEITAVPKNIFKHLL